MSSGEFGESESARVAETESADIQDFAEMLLSLSRAEVIISRNPSQEASNNVQHNNAIVEPQPGPTATTTAASIAIMTTRQGNDDDGTYGDEDGTYEVDDGTSGDVGAAYENHGVAYGIDDAAYDEDDYDEDDYDEDADDEEEDEDDDPYRGLRRTRLPDGQGWELCDNTLSKEPGDEWLQRGEQDYLPNRPRRWDWQRYGDTDWQMIDDPYFPTVPIRFHTVQMWTEWERIRNAGPGDRVLDKFRRFSWNQQIGEGGGTAMVGINAAASSGLGKFSFDESTVVDIGETEIPRGRMKANPWNTWEDRLLAQEIIRADIFMCSYGQTRKRWQQVSLNSLHLLRPLDLQNITPSWRRIWRGGIV